MEVDGETLMYRVDDSEHVGAKLTEHSSYLVALGIARDRFKKFGRGQTVVEIDGEGHETPIAFIPKPGG